MVDIQIMEMNEEDLIERKIMLENAKIYKDETDAELVFLLEQLESQVPKLLIEEDIKCLKEDLEKGVVHNKLGVQVDATDTDKLIMEATIRKLNQVKKLDLPMRGLRLKINNLREAKARIDSPERQIKVLEKEIRTKKISRVAPKRNIPPGVR